LSSASPIEPVALRPLTIDSLLVSEIPVSTDELLEPLLSALALFNHAEILSSFEKSPVSPTFSLSFASLLAKKRTKVEK